MNILHIDLGREMRGGQWQAFYLIRHLASAGPFTPAAACPARSPLAEKLREIGVKVIPLPGSGRFNPISIARLLCAGRRHKFALIHTHDARAASLGALLRRLWGRKTKLVHTRRVSYPVKRSSLGKYRLADITVGVSQDTVDCLIRCGLDPRKLRAIHSGIDLSRYSPRRPRADQRLIFAMVGAFTPQKGHSVLVKAMSLLEGRADGLPPWEVRLVGDGPLFESSLSLACELGVEQRLSMLGRQDAAGILPDCDIMLVPSVDGEGSSGAIKEAWAVGLPLICSDLAANLELAAPEQNSLVFPSGNEAELAEAMRRLALNPQLRLRLADAGAQSVQNFTAEKMAGAYLNLYQELLG